VVLYSFQPSEAIKLLQDLAVLETRTIKSRQAYLKIVSAIDSSPLPITKIIETIRREELTFKDL